jgi:hypothetical protein
VGSISHFGHAELFSHNRRDPLESTERGVMTSSSKAQTRRSTSLHQSVQKALELSHIAPAGSSSR